MSTANQTSITNPSSSSSLERKSSAPEPIVQLVSALDKYQSVIPEPVIAQILGKAGCNITDPNVLKMVSLALHRYLASIAKDARYYSAVRTGDNEPSSIVIEDLLLSLQENACVVERPPYFVDGPT